MRLLSVNVGRPREVEWRGRKVLTSIWKFEVPDRRWVDRLNVAGDAQADLMAHGGEHRAVYVYDVSAYRHWERELGRDDFVKGQFGENFTVEGLPDDEVCVGDRYRIGSALFEVTQPRVTCYRLGLRMDEPQMPALLYTHGRPGFYLRVLEEGEVGAGDAIERVAVGQQAMTVRDVSALLYLPGQTRRELERALTIPALSEGWQGSFRALLEQLRDGATGNRGLAPPSSGPPAWAGLRPFRIAAVQPESRSIASFGLEPVDGEPLPSFRAGQYLTVRVQPPGSPRALLRSYSLSTAPDARRYRISVKREGVVSAYLHDELGPGDVVEIGAPRGLFELAAEDDAPVALLSAGVGATPVLAMLASLAGDDPRREVWWIHGARNGAERALAHPLQPTGSVRRAGPRLRRRGPRDTRRAPGARRPPRRADVPLRADGLDARALGGDADLGRRARVHPHRDLRIRAPGGSRPPAAPAGRRAGHRSRGGVHHLGPHRALGSCVRQPARARRGLRRAGRLVMPDRRLPPL